MTSNLTSPKGENTPARQRIVTALMLAVVFASLAMLNGTASAQPEVEFSKTYGGAQDDFAHAVVQTSDGGFLVAGQTLSFGAGGQDIWLFKTDKNGNELWGRTYGGTEDDIAYDVQETSDGGFVIAGETRSFQTGAGLSDFWLVKTDASGNEEFAHRYGNVELPGILDLPTDDVAQSVRQTSDGGYILAGWSRDGSSENAWMVKTSEAGILEWSSQFGGDFNDRAYGVQQTLDGGYVLAGKTGSFSIGGDDYWIIKTDASGISEWTNTFGGEFNDEARAVVETADGGFALAGFSWSFGSGLSDYWLVKTDDFGEREWSRAYGGLPRDAAHALQQTSDGGYILAGWSESFSGGDHIWVVKTAPFGAEEWSRTYGESSGARGIRETRDGGFVIAGWSGPVEGIRDIRLVKTVSEAIPPSEGPVAVLENTGPSGITAAVLGFDNPDPGAVHKFRFRGAYLDRTNPLPPGEVACTLPLSGLTSRPHLILDQIESSGNGFVDAVTTSNGSPAVTVDVTALPFDLTHQAVSGGRIAGTFSVVSESPCMDDGGGDLGPAAPTGLSVSVPESQGGVLELDWDDNTESNLAGYSVFLSIKSTGPYGRAASLITESEYSYSGLADGTTYYYLVSAVDNNGVESAKSNLSQGVPAELLAPNPPTGLRLVRTNGGPGTARLEWNRNSEVDLAGYNVYRKDAGSPIARIEAGVTIPEYIDSTAPSTGDYFYAVTAVDRSGNESGRSNLAPLEMDFFATLNAISGSVLELETDKGLVEVVVTPGSRIEIPQVDNATIDDLGRGDHLAVSLIEADGILVAHRVFLVPEKTQSRHVPGSVVALSEDELTIQPPGEERSPITFRFSPSVQIKFHRGLTELTEGAFVVVSALRDARTGELPRVATEINVTPGIAPGRGRSARPEPANSVSIVGVFQGINPEKGALRVSDIEISLNPDSELQAGLVAGDAVNVSAELLPGGTVLALEVGPAHGPRDSADRTTLSGFFEGVDQTTGRWAVSGAEVRVDRRTDTDGIPDVGQQVRVYGFPGTGGSLLAREIENELGLARNGDAKEDTSIEGVFQGINRNGTWLVGGRTVAVDAMTTLRGGPEVGRRLEVEAVLENGRAAVAREIKAETRLETGTTREARVRGIAEEVRPDGTIVLNGLEVAVGDLTERAGPIRVDDAVEIKAVLLQDGVLLAREVRIVSQSFRQLPEPSRVDVEGKVDRVNPDGSLLVNGIRVETSALSDVRGPVGLGSLVKVRGILQRNGSIIARTLVGQGRISTPIGTAAKIEGEIQKVVSDGDGNPTELVVNGAAAAVDLLTKLEIGLEQGLDVEVHAIVKAGRFLAAKVEPAGPRRSGTHQITLQGEIGGIQRDGTGKVTRLKVAGVDVSVVADSRIRGRIEIGRAVEVQGLLEGGLLVSRLVEAEDLRKEKAEALKFKIRGVVEEAQVSDQGNLIALAVDGERIVVEPLTTVLGIMQPEQPVVVEGVVRAGSLLAANVAQDAGARERNTAETESKGRQNPLTDAAAQARARARANAAAERERARAAK